MTGDPRRRRGRAAVVAVGFLAAGLWGLPARPDSPASDAWLARHWQRPLAAQGEVPEGFSPIEASLDPKSCGTCHPTQFAAWGTTGHSQAFSPGLAGQLVDYAPTEQAACLRCHSPLHEQSPHLAGSDTPNPTFEATLQATGVSCAVCHVRGWQRFGPPRGGHSLPDGPVHGGVTRRPEFESAQFCASCHQFPAGWPSANGKPLENTVAEWQASRFAREGRACQSCHMPDRQHRWRGIHDPATVRDGVSLATSWMPNGTLTAVLTNTQVGHAFPTYVTPTVEFRGWWLDGVGNEVPGTRRTRVIARRVDLSGDAPVEISDTRLLPGRSVDLVLPQEPRGRTVRIEVYVRPDDYYAGFYGALLRQPARSERSRRLLRQALAAADSSPYVALSKEVVRP